MVKNIPVEKIFVRLPKKFLKDKRISLVQAVWLSEMVSLSLKTGYCFADKEYFADLLDIDVQTVTNIINKFKKMEFLKTSVLVEGRKKKKILIPCKELIELYTPTTQNKVRRKKENHSKSEQTSYKYDVDALIKKMENEAMNDEYGFGMEF